jgi:hypothetical protein
MSKNRLVAYTVRDYEKDGKKDAFWSRIGTVFEHKDGKGYDVLLDALPVNGRVIIREPRSKDDAEE